MKASDLKASLLQLAVSGKLVLQDPNDEPAGALLKRIKKEREALVKAGKIKTGKPLAEISEDEIPFEIPSSWEWVRLGDIIQLISGRDLTPEEYTDKMCGIPYLIGASNVENGIITVERWTEQPKVISLADDLLLSCKGTVGKTAIQKLPQAHIARQFMSLRPYFGIDIFYFKIFIDNYVPILISQAKSMIPGISREDVLPIMCPLPPLSEQQRIVARIEELMPLIEAYGREEQKLSALEAELPDALRQSILQYAVEGKLVPQKAEDGTAAKLLAKIRKEREALVKEGKIKMGKPLAPVSEEEKPFSIPVSWEWVRLGDICEYIHRGKSPIYSCIKEIPVVAQKCIQWSGIQMDKALFIDPDSFNKYTEERYLRTNDLLWNSTGLGTLGRIGIYDERLTPYQIAVADSHVTVIRPIKSQIDSLYLYYWFAGPSVQNTINDKSTGSTKQTELATQTIKEHIVPLPPLAEQHRIVERIEELMELCDRIPLHGK